MSAKKKSTKVRVDFRKNRAERTRETNWTRQFQEHGFQSSDTETNERISGKGDLVRRRTIVQEVPKTVSEISPTSERENYLTGRVLRVHGLNSMVETEDGRVFLCTTRRILKTMTTDLRHVVVAGDRVVFRDAKQPNRLEGVIEQVEPRRGVIARSSRQRQHILVANVDLVVIVASAALPPLKPNLIDRFLITAEHAGIRPLICINKVDLVNLADLQPLIGVYSQMGYTVLPISAATGFGMDRLRRHLQSAESVFIGQSGVGKSSLLNSLDPTLTLRVGEINRETNKGKHTTTTAELLKLSFGGYIVDTPGVRQFTLWDVIPEEVFGFYRDLRPYENRCRFPDCTHLHETACAVKNGVADGLLDIRRYESYVKNRGQWLDEEEPRENIEQ